MSVRDKQVNNSGRTDGQNKSDKRYRNRYLSYLSATDQADVFYHEEGISGRKTKKEVSLRAKRERQRKYIHNQSRFNFFFIGLTSSLYRKIFPVACISNNSSSFRLSFSSVTK